MGSSRRGQGMDPLEAMVCPAGGSRRWRVRRAICQRTVPGELGAIGDGLNDPQIAPISQIEGMLERPCRARMMGVWDLPRAGALSWDATPLRGSLIDPQIAQTTQMLRFSPGSRSGL